MAMKVKGVATSGGRQAAVLLVAAGALTVVNNYLPGNEHLDIGTLNAIAALAICVGVLCWFLPWERYSPRASLVIAPFALGLIASADYLGGVSAYSYAVYFVVLFVWIGLAHPPGTALLVLAPTAAAYVWPLWARGDPVGGGVASVTVALPVCLLVAETIARTVRRRLAAQDETTLRSELSARLVGVVADVNAVLDPDQVLPRLCEGTRGLLNVEAAAYIRAADGVATIVATSGLPPDFLGSQHPVSGGTIEEILRTGEPIVIKDLNQADIRDRVHEVLAEIDSFVGVPCFVGGEIHGAVYVAVGAQRGALVAAELDALQVLTGHVAAALRNAATHAEVLRRQAHEQAVIDGMADGLAVLDSAGIVRSWNAAAQELTGISAEAAIGSPVPPQLAGPGTVQHRQPDGRWLEVLTSPLADGEWVMSIRDVSQAKELDEAKDLFLATTSHELRTPLTVIKGFTSTLEKRWRDLPDATRDEALQTMVERTSGLIQLVENLLLSARAGANRHSLSIDRVALAPLLAAAVQDVRAVTTAHELRLHVPDDLPDVMADPTGVGHVIGQLLENAVKYSPDGGVIDVDARATEDRVEVVVADRGVGLPTGGEGSIFDRFVQGQRGDRRDFGGVGLGLHIVRTLVESMGGYVEGENRPDGGARFAFTLPAAGAHLLDRELERGDGQRREDPLDGVVERGTD